MREPEENEAGSRRWVAGSELAELWQALDDPGFDVDLEQIGEEMIDPWDQ